MDSEEMTLQIGRSTSAKATIDEMVAVFRTMISILQAESDSRLAPLADSLEASLKQLDGLRGIGLDKKIDRRIVAGLRQGIRDLPVLLRSLAPDKAEEILTKLQSLIEGEAQR